MRVEKGLVSGILVAVPLAILLVATGGNSIFLLVFQGLTIVLPAVVLIAGATRNGALDVLSPFGLVPMTLGIIYSGAPSYLRDEQLYERAAQVELALIYAAIAYYVGVLLVYLLSPKKAILPMRGRRFDGPVIDGNKVTFVFVIGAVSMVLYWRAAGGIPILQGDLENSRLEALAGSGVPFYLSMLMMIAFWVGLSPKSSLSRLSKIAMFLVGFGLLSTSGWRNTIFAYAVVAILLIHYVRPIRTKVIALAGGATVLIAAALGLYRVFSSDLTHYSTYQKLVEGDFLAAFTAYLESYRDVFGSNLAVVFQVVPDALPYQEGKTLIWNFVSLLPWVEQEPFDFVLKRAAGMGFAGGGLPPTLIGEWYLNFSWEGVWIGMILVGSVVTVAHRFVRETRSFRGLIVGTVVIYYVFVSVRGGVGNVLLTLVWLILATVLTTWFARASVAKSRSVGMRQSFFLDPGKSPNSR